MRKWIPLILGVMIAAIPTAYAARNGSGTYTVPNTAVSGATISSSDWNENFEDVGDEITNSLPRDGQAGMTGQLKATSGTVSVPSITFTADSDTGIYRSASGEISIAVDGVAIATFNSTGLTVNGAVSGQSSTSTPAGMVVAYAGSTPPSGFLMAYGQCVSRTTYATLFTAISTTYDNGCAGTEFGIPDLRGRVAAGQDDMNASGGSGTSANRLTDVAQPAGGSLDGDVLGDTGGAETHTTLTAELASHTHGAGSYSVGTSINNGTSVARASSYDIIANSGSGTSALNSATGPSTLSLASGSVSGTGGSAGSGTAHDIVQPTIILNYIIKY